MEPAAQPDLTTDTTTIPLMEPTPEPEPFEILHMNKTASVEAEAAAIDLPSDTTPITDPTPPEPTILDIFDNA